MDGLFHVIGCSIYRLMATFICIFSIHFACDSVMYMQSPERSHYFLAFPTEGLMVPLNLRCPEGTVTTNMSEIFHGRLGHCLMSRAES